MLTTIENLTPRLAGTKSFDHRATVVWAMVRLARTESLGRTLTRTEKIMMKDLLTPAQLADYLSVPGGTIYAWNSRGTGPRRIRVGRHVRYRRVDVDAWLASQEVAAPRW